MVRHLLVATDKIVRQFRRSSTVFIRMLGCAGLGLAISLSALQLTANGQEPAKRRAKATVELEDRPYLLGENVNLRFGITNTQDEPFIISEGGDYRGGMRPLRFRVAAFNADGQSVEDPYRPPRILMGGFVRSHTVAPKQTHWLHVPLGRYCEFKEPGEYTLKVYHDLGWDDDSFSKLSMIETPRDDHSPPIGEATIRFAMPTREQAQDLVNRMVLRVRGKRADVGYGKDGVDFSTLRLPVYLPLLKRLMFDRNADVAWGARQSLNEAVTAGRIEQLSLTAEESQHLFDELSPAWGDEQLGVQFGIISADECRQFRLGERVPLAVFVRNVSETALEVNLYASFPQSVPMVVNDRGETVQLQGHEFKDDVYASRHRLILKSGESFGVRHPGVRLGKTPGKRIHPAWAEYPCWNEPAPGRYTLSQSLEFSVRRTSTTDESDEDRAKNSERANFTTGPIDFEVIEAESVAPEEASELVRGRVVVVGPRPSFPPLTVSVAAPQPTSASSASVDGQKTREEAIDTEIIDPSIAIGPGGGLGNVFVYLPQAPDGRVSEQKPAEPVVIESRPYCLFPRSVIVRSSQNVMWRNRTSESVRLLASTGDTESSVLLLPPSSETQHTGTWQPREAGPHSIQSASQPWKKTNLLVLDHPFSAVTRADGSFEIRDLPPGDHVLHAWHERLGFLTKDRTITVRGRPTATISFSISVLGDQLGKLGLADAKRTPEQKHDRFRRERRLIKAILQDDPADVERLVKDTDLADLDTTNLKGFVLWCPNPFLVDVFNDRLRLDLTPLQHAVIHRDPDKVRQLLEAMDESSRRKQLAGSELHGPSPSLLHLAALHGGHEIISELVRHGARVNDNVNQYVQTPLAVAAEHGHVSAVNALIDAGADVNLRADYTALMRACISDQVQTAKILLTHEADPNISRHDGQRALHLAAKNGAIECVQLLLDYGADPSALAYERDTALVYALRKNHDEIARLLRAAAEVPNRMPNK